MNTVVVPEEKRFARNISIMIKAVSDSITKLYNNGYKTIDPSLVTLAGSVITGFNDHYLIKGFIKSSHEKCWDSIRNRDEKFFIENSKEIFEFLPMDKVDLFRDLFLAKDSNGVSIISIETKTQLWELFEALVKISIKYVHKGRSPYSYSTPEGVKYAYGKAFFDNVDLSHHAPIWKVELDFPLNY